MNGMNGMNGMKRMTISIPVEMESAIVELRKTDLFCRSSYAEIIREILNAGMSKIEKKAITTKTTNQ